MKNTFAKIQKLTNKAQAVDANTTANNQEIISKAKALKQQNKLKEAIELLEAANKGQENAVIIELLANFLLDAGQYRRVSGLSGIQKHDPRSYAIAATLAKMDVCNTLPICIDGHQPLEKAAFVTMVKDEEDIILYNLVWHYGLGFRKFFIIDNQSSDRTVERINQFAKIFASAQVFLLHDPVVGHFQGRKMTGASRFVMTLWPDLEWLGLIDADEFLCPNQALHTLLAKIPKGADAIIAPKSMYLLHQGDSTEEDDVFFRRIQHRRPTNHISNKAIMRANLDFDISQGNHRIFGQDGAEIKNYFCSPDLVYREFSVRSRPHFIRKIINGGKAVAEAKRLGFNKVGGRHWEALYNLYLKEGEQGLANRLQVIIKRDSAGTNLFDPFPMDKMVDTLDAPIKTALATCLEH